MKFEFRVHRHYIGVTPDFSSPALCLAKTGNRHGWLTGGIGAQYSRSQILSLGFYFFSAQTAFREEIVARTGDARAVTSGTCALCIRRSFCRRVSCVLVPAHPNRCWKFKNFLATAAVEIFRLGAAGKTAKRPTRETMHSDGGGWAGVYFAHKEYVREF